MPESFCPACNGERILERMHLPDARTEYSACLTCGALWECLPAGEAMFTDDERMPFADPCNNCAFRAGSPESQDKQAWRELLAKLKAGGSFFCHKGVPIATETIPTADDQGMTVHEFRFPTDDDGNPDPSQMRMCRGFLNAWIRWNGVRRRA